MTTSNAPRVAVVNREFARRVFGSVPDGLDHYFKLRDGGLIQVVGVVEDGKIFESGRGPEAGNVLPAARNQPASSNLAGGALQSIPDRLTVAVRSKLRELDPGLPVHIQPWTRELQGVLFPARMATLSLGVLGVMGAMLSITGIFGLAAYSVSKRLRELGIRIALGAKPQEVLRAALARPFKLLAFGSVAGLILGLLATRAAGGHRVSGHASRPIRARGRRSVAWRCLGLLATWIPAHRALNVDPLILLRDE